MSTGFGNGKGSSNNRLSKSRDDDDTWEEKRTNKANKASKTSGKKYDNFKKSKEGKKVGKFFNKIKNFALAVITTFFGVIFGILGIENPLTKKNDEKDICKIYKGVSDGFFGTAIVIFGFWILFHFINLLIYIFDFKGTVSDINNSENWKPGQLMTHELKDNLFIILAGNNDDDENNKKREALF